VAARVIDLREQPRHVAQLAHWHHREWAHLYPHESEQDFARELAQACGAGPLPSTFIAVDGDELLGSASLLAQDMDSHAELSPWLASVYVHPEARGRGLGAALVQAVTGFAAHAGFAALHLFTPASEDWYRQFGFQTLARERYQGTPVAVMRALLLCAAP
jgi:predicted N-acetyltransferase YhbS